MSTRNFRRRPRRVALLTIVAAIATGLIASGAVAALVEDGPGPFSVIVPNKETSSPLVSVGDASVKYIGSNAQDQASGTGLFDPFVRLQKDGAEQGYNTNGAVEFETKSGQWTHAIKVNAIPIVDCNGPDPGTATCWELFVDINDSNNAKYIALTDMEIWFTTNENLVGYVGDGTTGTGFPAPASKEYDFDGEIHIHDVNQGSGRGDLLYLVPTAGHDWTGDTYFVLFSRWGSATAAPDNKTFASDGGFEEWKVRKTPNLSIVKTADATSVNAGDDIGFTITVTNNGVADATNVTISDPLPSGSGINWSESPDNPNCTITTAGTPAVQTLNCGPVTLAPGGELEVHVESATTAASCGQYNNIATFTSTNAGSGSDDASVTVNCGAIRILKNSTKGGAVATAGATFSITGAGITGTLSVTDDATAAAPDEDAAIGVVCVSGLVPGATYTVNETDAPTGYGDATETDVTVVASNGSCSTTELNSATFTNAPLGEIEINYTDLGSGETSAKIDCGTLAATPADATPSAHDDTSETYTNLPGGNPPIVYTCTISVDP